MNIHHIGIITGGAQSQGPINKDHAHDIASALEYNYTIHYYDLSVKEDIYQLIQDRKNNRLDIIFNNAAGKKGGDGTVEGFLTILDIPFIGSETLATAVAFDKKTAKYLAREAGIPTVPGIDLPYRLYKDNQDKAMEFIEANINYPLVVKASRGSDSIGITLVKCAEDLVPALDKVYKEDETAIIEKYIVRVAEITCMVFGNEKNTFAFEAVENYYETELLGVGGPVIRRVPTLKKKILNRIKSLSLQMHKTVGCSDYSRSDFLVDASGQIYFLEINAHPGLGKNSPTSFSSKLTRNWEYDDMIQNLLRVSLERHGL